MEPKPKKRNKTCGRKGCGKAVPWKSPNPGLFHLAWESANPADFHFPTAPAATVIYLLFARLENQNPNPTSAEINLSQAKNGLDNGVHLIGPVNAACLRYGVQCGFEARNCRWPRISERRR